LKLRKIFLFLLITLSSLYPQAFRFAVWGDSQFQNPEVFEKTVKRTEFFNPSFVIHVGDMIHGYTYNIENARRQWKRFQKQIEPLSVPFYPTPGNHDVTTKEIQPAYTEAWGEDKLYYSFSFNNSHFIILNAFLDQKFDSIPLNELKWLEEELERSKNFENIFITIHSPLYLNQKYNWEPIHKLLMKYPVKAVFSGHYHIYDFRIINGIKYFCLNSSGNMPLYNELAGRSHHFLMVEVEGESISEKVYTEKNTYAPEFILPGESQRASVLEGKQTIEVRNPETGIDTSIYLVLHNSADHRRNYKISAPSSSAWSFFPEEHNSILVESGKSDSVLFRIKYEGGNINRTDMPSFRVISDYTTLKKDIIEHDYPVQLFYPPQTYAYYTEEEIIIDGVDSDSSWSNSESIKEMYIDYDNTPAAEKTIVKILYSTEYIFVFVKGEEAEPEGLSSAAYGEIPLVFGDDDFELYFDTNRDKKTFYRLMVNPAGTILSSGPEGRFSFSFDVKSYIGKDFWSAEFRIPLQEFKIKTGILGQLWGFNVRRHRQQADIPQSDWSKMNNYPPYQPEYFGLLIFK
jgi:predicted phosphodiesterase